MVVAVRGWKGGEKLWPGRKMGRSESCTPGFGVQAQGLPPKLSNGEKEVKEQGLTGGTGRNFEILGV